MIKTSTSLESISLLFQDDAVYPNVPKWKSSPKILEDLLCLVETLKFPSLSASLPLISPCIVRCLDDHEVNSRMVGLKLLLHVFQHIEPHVLLRSNLNQVYWKSILHCTEFASSIPHSHLFYLSMKAGLELLPISHGRTLSDFYYNDLLVLTDLLLKFLQSFDFKHDLNDYLLLIQLLVEIVECRLTSLSLQFAQRIIHVLCRPLFLFSFTQPTDIPTSPSSHGDVNKKKDNVNLESEVILNALSSLLTCFPILQPRLSISVPEIMTSLCVLITNGMDPTLIKNVKNYIYPLLKEKDLAFLKRQYLSHPKVTHFLS